MATIAIVGLAIILAAVMLGGTSHADTTPTAGKTTGTIERPTHDVADYHRDPLPGATLCLEDHTGGFPIAAAAAEFDGIVDITVTDDCTGHRNIAIVQTVIRSDESWSGWYNSPNAERDGAALISLNLGEAYRHDPASWRKVAAHEIGHAVGLGHSHEGETIMDPYLYPTVDGLTRQDRDQLAEIYGGGR